MPHGGKLTIETSNACLDEACALQFDDVAPGQYELLSVTDTGTGIAPDVLQRMFQPPNLPEKVPGSACIYLPRLMQVEETRSAPAAKPIGDSPVPRAAPQETLLVVEDNPHVREYAKTCLEELGYAVFEAGDTADALRILQSGERIDLLFTDVVLPDASGRELSRHALKLRPDLPILFTTGYTRNAIVHQGRLDTGVKFLSELLDGRASR